jgi:putative nucleotidyltransferase with HDIG domain
LRGAKLKGISWFLSNFSFHGGGGILSVISKKKYKRLYELREGDVVGEAVISHAGQVLVYQGTIVTVDLVQKLAEWSIYEVVIAAEKDEAEIQHRNLKEEIDTFNSLYNILVTETERAFTNLIKTGNFSIQEFRDISHRLLTLALSHTGTLDRLALLPRSETFVYEHSVTVGILSVVIGRWMGVTPEELRALALGGLIHDIGKCYISPELFSKYRHFTDDDSKIMETHCVKGYRVVESVAFLNSAVKYIVLQHHEKMDGSGYPTKTKEAQIHPLAGIVGLADYFDLLTFEQGIQKRRTPYQVIDILLLKRFGTLSPTVSDTFFRHCKELLLGGVVRLNDGTMGRVVYIHPQHPTRPVIQVGPDFFINLSEEKGLHIEALLNEYTDVVKPIG